MSTILASRGVVSSAVTAYNHEFINIRSVLGCSIARPLASTSRTSIVDPRRHYSPSHSRRTNSSDGKDEPPKKKQGFFSWLRRDITQDLIKPEASSEEIEAAKRAQEARGDANLFDSISRTLQSRQRDEVSRIVGADIPEDLSPQEAKSLMKKALKPKPTEHKYSTAMFKISHRKLNDLGRQISGKPIDQAILQMVFSEKRASTRIKSMLCVARDHAIEYKDLDRSRLIVSQAWVEKGPKLKRIDIKGRGRHGIKEHPKSRLRVVLKHGKTYEERIAYEYAYKLNKVRSPGLMREDTPVRNYSPAWAW